MSFIIPGPVVLEKKFLKNAIKSSLIQHYLPLKEGMDLLLNKLEPPLLKDTLWQVWLKLAECLLRRKLKCEKFTMTTTTRTENGQILFRKTHFGSDMSSRVEHKDFSQRLQLPENVADPLESGVDDFHLMISNMSDEKLATPNGRSFMNYFEKNVLPHCNHMNKNFRDMQTNTQNILKKVNKEIEELTKDLNDLKSQKKTTENKMQELEGDLEEFKIKQSEADQRHREAMSDLSGTKTLKEYLEDKREKAKVHRNRSTIAFGLTILIPGVNVVTYMIKKSMQEKLDRCNRNLDIALEKIKSCKNDMEALEKTIQKLNNDIAKNQEAYHQLDKDIQENNTKRSSLLQNQKNFEKIQDQLRKICRAIDDISSASGCVLQQSKGCYSIEPLILPAETLVDRLQNLVYDHHLSSSRKLHESLRDIESQIVSLKDKLNADALPTPNFCVKFLCCFKKR